MHEIDVRLDKDCSAVITRNLSRGTFDGIHLYFKKVKNKSCKVCVGRIGPFFSVLVQIKLM